MSSSSNTAYSAAKSRTLTITDLMTIGIFFVINLVAGVAISFIGITPVTYVMITSAQALILGIPMMLFLAKVHKPGMVLIFLALGGIASLLLGLGVWALVLSLVMAIIAELVLRAGKYESSIHSIIAYAFMAVAPTASYIPLFFATQQYVEDSDIESNYGANFADGLASIGQMSWLFAIIVIVTFICGIFGGLLGRRIFTKHFERAGIA
ncbi:MptD family putative ECF transporter S component [Corynebacterium sp. TAE3-ERU2]|uniref:MptD family putative ECF transporter S component n=1 Tax=Corynebacterium sp. TAE3-ERU2 TaxID=2849497 RepID=UPI001C47DEAD|nr:MptD family putative ECF transporter S component [Corynebacterium sp. TAE3-ERU2]MBV7301030.1 MptD family putative ECF transporter S component [Corynebacterium sp. TAE3-ERU2]